MYLQAIRPRRSVGFGSARTPKKEVEDMHDQHQADSDETVLDEVRAAVELAGRVLLDRFSDANRVGDASALLAAIAANDEASSSMLRPALETIRPAAQWDEDEEGQGSLGAGEWWVVDAAEGNVNHIHGSNQWGVTATLVRDDEPVLTVVHLPALGQTYTALQGRGAFLNGERLTVSAKTDLAAALVGTGQAMPGEDAETRRQLSDSIDRMLDAALLVSASVPATLQIVQVAAGHSDAFWQFGQVRSGLIAGALLVREAGGAVTDSSGAPWTLGSRDFVAAAPGVSPSITRVLSDTIPRSTTRSSTMTSTITTIAVLGSGRVGSALAGALASGDQRIVIGTRDPEAARQRWDGPAVEFAGTLDAISAAELVVNATPGDSSLDRLTGYRDALAGRILLDVSNATARDADGLPAGLLYPESSLGERLQAALPSTRVVKSLNTMLFSAMTRPGSLGSTPTAFVSGDDDEAKAVVRELLRGLGWHEQWIIDLGAIDTARGTEALALLVPSLLKSIGFAPFALSVAR